MSSGIPFKFKKKKKNVKWNWQLSKDLAYQKRKKWDLSQLTLQQYAYFVTKASGEIFFNFLMTWMKLDLDDGGNYKTMMRQKNLKQKRRKRKSKSLNILVI